MAIMLLLALSPAGVDGLAFRVHRIQTERQCWDTVAFRRWDMRCERRVPVEGEYGGDRGLLKRIQKELLDARTSTLRSAPPREVAKYEAFGGSTVQFAAVLDSSDGATDDDDESILLERMVGVIEAEPLPASRGRTFALPSCWHIANLRTHRGHRRRGIGSALIEAVVRHAESEHLPALGPMGDDEDGGNHRLDAVTLKVETDQNPAAASLYEGAGFAFDDRVYRGFMIRYISC